MRGRNPPGLAREASEAGHRATRKSREKAEGSKKHAGFRHVLLSTRRASECPRQKGQVNVIGHFWSGFERLRGRWEGITGRREGTGIAREVLKGRGLTLATSGLTLAALECPPPFACRDLCDIMARPVCPSRCAYLAAELLVANKRRWPSAGSARACISRFAPPL